MRLTRLVLEAPQNRASLSFHPRFTVMAGVPAPVRAHLTAEVLGGFSGERSGVHLELVNSSKRRITVIRPVDGAHRASAPDDDTDLTEDFSDASGRVDVLSRYGITKEPNPLLIDAASVRPSADDERVARLAELDQSELWSSAARVQVTEAEFTSLTAQLEKAGGNAEAVAQVEKRHQDLDAAVTTQQTIQRNLLRVSTLALLAAALVAGLSSINAVPLVVIAAATLALALVFRAKVASAARQEETALAEAGSNSYLGFVVNQVDGLMSDTEQRRRLSSVAADHREAAIAWTRLAGDVSANWAFTHQAQIDAVAQLRRQLAATNTLSAAVPEVDANAAAVARLVIGRMTELRRIGYGAESFPLLLDDPFCNLTPATRLALLELISRDAGSPQVILLTDEADVADWARSQAPAGEVALLEPLGPAVPSEPADRPAHRVTGHAGQPGTGVGRASDGEVRGAEHADAYPAEARVMAV